MLYGFKGDSMYKLRSIVIAMCLGAALFALWGCSAKVGSEEWCAQMKNKPKGDWSANEAADFAKHCIFE